MERWRMRDPFHVVARMEEQRQRQLGRTQEARQDAARSRLEALFGGAMADRGTISEIENWIAWCWHGEDPTPSTPTRCYSAEGRYVAPATDDDRRARRIINVRSAERVQAVYDRMPMLTRQVLRFEYTQRAAYDQWERGEEVAPDGGVRKVWVCTGNTRRMMARLRLKISREEYRQHVEAFKAAVREEFEREVCA